LSPSTNKWSVILIILCHHCLAGDLTELYTQRWMNHPPVYSSSAQLTEDVCYQAGGAHEISQGWPE